MKNNCKLFKLGVPNYITVETDIQTYISSVENSTINFEKTQIEFIDSSEHEDIFLTSKDSIKSIKLRWKYEMPSKAKYLSDAWERGYGDLEWRGLSGSRFMPWYFLVNHQQETLCFGVKVRPAAMCYWQADTSGITLFLDVRCGGIGVQLNNRRLSVAQIICMQATNISSFEAAHTFCHLMCTDPIFPKIPVYGSNNWYYAYGNSSEAEILTDTDYVLHLTKNATNPPFMVIDDCWQEHHRLNEYNSGPWRSGNKKFPDMQGLAKKLKDKGVHPGIWLRLLQNEDTAIPDDWRLPHTDCLDPSHPGALAYIKKDIERICNWGYELIKHDFTTFDLFGKWGFEMNPLVTIDGWHFYNRSKTSAEIIIELYQSIYSASKTNNTIIIGCNTIGHLGAGLMHINRTGDDTSGLNWERTRRMGINTLAFRLPQHGTFYHVDADCVGIAGNIPWHLNRQWADVLAQSGTPLFLSIKPGILNSSQEKELQQIISIASRQDNHKIPLDWEYTDCPSIWGEGDNIIKYNWYDEAGQTLKSKEEKYSAYIPVP